MIVKDMMNIQPQNKEPQNCEGIDFDIRYSLFDILRFKKISDRLRSKLSKSMSRDVKRERPAMDLSWVDEFITNIRPYVHVRPEDHLMIKRPNTAQKLNSTGVFILKSLLDGKTIHELLNEIGREEEKIHDISEFMIAVKHQMEGKLDEFSQNPAVDVVPFVMPFSRYPVLSEIAITYRCNLKCVFCYAGCGCTANPIRSDSELPVHRMKEVIWKLFHHAKVPSVSFTGGEPTLFEGLPELIGYAKEIGMRVNLITNGTTITRHSARMLAQNGLDSAQVSVEGVTPSTHDRTVGVAGSFHKSVQSVGFLKDAGIAVHTHTTITQLNIHECFQFPEFTKKVIQNDRFSMNLMIPCGSGSVNEEIVVPYRDVAEIIQEIIRKSRDAGVEFMWYSPIPMCMFNAIVHGLGNKGCSACDGLISIAPNGEVLPCASYDDSVGNFLEEDFDALWQSPKARYYREKRFAHPKCRLCEHFHICNGACPLYWRQMGYDEFCTCQNPDRCKIKIA
ncbi:MAG: radical SAM protein [Desulfobacterales bacterium]|jgi:radical SAM protein with 4Fe4S-binding SPASM domain|nr:radical SAM protein [Desulfobacterales bacterium]